MEINKYSTAFIWRVVVKADLNADSKGLIFRYQKAFRIISNYTGDWWTYTWNLHVVCQVCYTLALSRSRAIDHYQASFLRFQALSFSNNTDHQQFIAFGMHSVQPIYFDSHFLLLGCRTLSKLLFHLFCTVLYLQNAQYRACFRLWRRRVPGSQVDDLTIAWCVGACHRPLITVLIADFNDNYTDLSGYNGPAGEAWSVYGSRTSYNHFRGFMMLSEMEIE